jgi:glutathione synthase/RimK-type ligase-like ATP-grasp enzyme
MIDVALITANQRVLRRYLAKRMAQSKENPLLQRWLAEHFREPQADTRIAMPEDTLLRDALLARGIHAEIAAWDNPRIDWSKIKLCVIRSPSDWPLRSDEFLRWAESVQRVSRVWNSVEVMRWVSDKSYLAQLEAKDMPVVPTCCFPRGSTVDLAKFLEEKGWSDAILKPLLGQGARNVIRTSLSTAAGAKPIGEAQVHLAALLKNHGALIQPYFPAVETEGELSLIYIDGRVTHAVRKFPRDGDFRAFGTPASRQESVALDDAMCAFAERAMHAVGIPVEFGRIDLIPGDRGEMRLLELELLQPRLFLSSSPEAVDVMVSAIGSAIDKATS